MHRPQDTLGLLTLTMIDGLGPVLIHRLLQHFGSPGEILLASASTLRNVEGVGPTRAKSIIDSRAAAADMAKREHEACLAHGVHLVGRGAPNYPRLLAELPDAPPILYVKGELQPHNHDRFPIAIVGSRGATAYGLEQAQRFAGVLASAGLTIVSGGARGIDTAAHHGALLNQGRTLAVLGSGLAKPYPPENKDLFDRIAASGALISELPLFTEPKAENFPARNRLISGLSLGVLVIEAGEKSGALITARIATEEHGRDVMALPSRVDSAAAKGSLALLKSGGAALVTEPGDVLHLLEQPGLHVHRDTHESRYPAAESPLFQVPDAASPPAHDAQSPSGRILSVLDEPRTLDELVLRTSMPVHELRSQLTLMEIRRQVVRSDGRYQAAKGRPG